MRDYAIASFDKRLGVAIFFTFLSIPSLNSFALCQHGSIEMGETYFSFLHFVRDYAIASFDKYCLENIK